ncbi:putative glutathione-S-transferase theta, GST [Biscogniauxia marginata]|nr:putative glutathione-S-transferase theta, GST [Biscogniauxia marginata]
MSGNENIHPVATGLARRTADEHSAEQPLKLIAGWFCPFVQRTWVTLEEKGIPYQYVELTRFLKSEQPPPGTPRGIVPGLEVAPGKNLYDSTILGEYLEDQYPNHLPRMLPPAGTDTNYERARARIWRDFVTSRVVPAFHWLLQFQPKAFEEKRGEEEGSGEKRLDELRVEFRNQLLELTREMSYGGPYFNGAEFGMVDIALLPWALRLWVFDVFKGGLRIPEPGQGGQDEGTWARWRQWLDAVKNRDSVKKTMSDREYYIPVYKRYADDTVQNELAKSIRSGKPLLP